MQIELTNTERMRFSPTKIQLKNYTILRPHSYVGFGHVKMHPFYVGKRNLHSTLGSCVRRPKPSNTAIRSHFAIVFVLEKCGHFQMKVLKSDDDLRCRSGSLIFVVFMYEI